MAFQDVGHGRSGDLVTEVGQRTLNTGVALRVPKNLTPEFRKF
jgi:hypothetical protein